MQSALRASRVVRKEQLSANPFAHHATNTGFWEKVRKAVVINPESSTGNPLASEFRQPEPGSRPERFSVPSSKASDIAENPYYARDTRRNYPKTEVVTQPELAKLLIAQGGFEALPPVSGAAEGTDSTAVTADSPAPSLASLYSANTSVATTSFRPPKPPGHKFVWKPSAEQAPSDPNAYFPMILYDTARA
ncbi:hypothetical protein JCM8202_005002 [Rhodotorula sphaerocarpa]